MRAAIGFTVATVAAGAVYVATDRPANDKAEFACTVSSITDGDTLRCIEQGSDGRAIRIRLSGIAAREGDGSCTLGHPCPDAPPEAATAALQRIAEGDRLQCQRVGTTYGRVAAFCQNSSGVDLSCAMVESGTVAKWGRYWGSHRC